MKDVIISLKGKECKTIARTKRRIHILQDSFEGLHLVSPFHLRCKAVPSPFPRICEMGFVWDLKGNYISLEINVSSIVFPTSILVNIMWLEEV